MITLKIDTAALRSLFPEGSEARLELQKTVILNVAREVGATKAGMIFGEFKAEVEKAAIEAARSSMLTYLEKQGNFWTEDPRKMSLRNQVVEKVKSEINEVINQHLTNALRNLRDEGIEKHGPILQGMINARIETLVSHQIEKGVKEAVAEKFKAALQVLEAQKP